MISRITLKTIAASMILAPACTAWAGVEYYTDTSRIDMSDGLLTFSDITQNGQTLVNYMDQGLTVNVNDVAFIFTPCGFNNSNIYYPNGGVSERITITRDDGRQFDVLEMNVSDGWASCDVFLWISVFDGNNLVAEFDETASGGGLIGLQGDFDRVVIGSYFDVATRDQHNESNTNAVALDNMEYGRGAGGYQLSVGGQCPGTVTVGWSGADPNAQQGLVIGLSQGSTTIPQNQPCGGTVLGIQGQVQLVTPPGIFSTGNGSGQISGTAGSAACGRYLQLVQGGSCITSNVEQIP